MRKGVEGGGVVHGWGTGRGGWVRGWRIDRIGGEGGRGGRGGKEMRGG